MNPGQQPAATIIEFSRSCGTVSVFQPCSCWTIQVRWQRKANAAEHEPFYSMCRRWSDTIRKSTSRLWKHYWNHAPVFPQTQGHRRRAALAKPEVLHSLRLGRAERRVPFEAKEPSVLEIAKGGGTGGIATLGDHNSTPLVFFASKRLGTTVLRTGNVARFW